MTPLELIQSLKLIFGRYPSMSGGCLKFALMLWRAFPQSRLYYNNTHVVTYIAGVCYDVDGVVEEKDLDGYMPIERFGFPIIESSFQEHLNGVIYRWLLEYFNVIKQPVP
jgi:hypothetical protein